MGSRGPVLLATLAATVLLSACGDTGGSGTAADGGGSADSSGSASPEPEPRDEASPVALECPRRLADAAGIVDPAQATPTFPRVEAAVVCSYLQGRSPDAGWERTVGPVEVPDDRLASLDDTLAGLRPAPADQMCTMDMGPRVLVLAATSDGVVGVVAEQYGCRQVLLTDDPADVAPGAGDTGLAVPGALSGGDAVLATVEPLLR
ncbi:hypothetical protein [Nocardioides marmoraquaticus]